MCITKLRLTQNPQKHVRYINQRIKNLGLTHWRAIEEETIGINSDWVYNQACRLLHDIHVVSHFLITFNYLF